MKVYNEKGVCARADKSQIEILLDAGWSLTKPEVKVAELVKQEVEPEISKPEAIKKPVKKLIKRVSTTKKD